MMAGRQTLCDYEERRRSNIEGNKIVLAKLMEDMGGMSPDPLSTNERKLPTRRAYKKAAWPLVIRRNPPRSVRCSPTVTPDHMRSRRGSLSSFASSSDSNDSQQSMTGKLVVRFGSLLGRSSGEDQVVYSDEEYDDDDTKEALPTLKRKPRSDHTPKLASEITEEDLMQVAEHVSDKKYDNFSGTTCHQCRQKTDDQKTICRMDSCFGVRGQFCGPCLKNRYGEDARESLTNADWMCPPCRGICNCSFCRRKAGKCSTGILIHVARKQGYKDVNALLQSFRKS